ncbi:type-F conjugative transfer system secretin TraK [Cronobacter turicensis]|nr:type-F conjugative transfer system secretin TraK [Cronobacter sakazakii]ELY4007655.1 type-F conjugative transfer system secretin TraK [Cronobacter dublinensis]ELY4410064.1 type-F conjugative transfer system secretin TraK [Cronobacter dublinensis]ELY4487605.1 type-F conjugative transfer system secretin TraK [Cronobacter dublinensis]
MKKILALMLMASSALATAAEKQTFPQNTQRVLPEISTQIVLSNRDLNRLVCESGEAIKPVYSKEKPVEIQVSSDRRSFWVKFKYLVEGSVNHYYSEPTEIYLTCGTSTFELIALPKYEGPHKILLGSDTKDRMKDNQSLFGALSLEEAAITLSTKMISDSGDNGKGLPESFEVVPQQGSWLSNIYDNRGRHVPVEVRKERDVLVDGTGLRGSQYSIRALNNVQLNETMFLNSQFGTNIFAVTAENLALSRGQLTTLVIIHRETM